MIECPNCRHQNMAGSAFCSECGVVFVSSDPVTTQQMEVEHTGDVAALKRTPGPTPPMPSDYWLTLHLLDSGEVLPLSDRNEFTIGRVTDGQPVMPDIDLAPYQAYSRGVSRLHAVITRGVDDVYIMDLDSANGTYVNGRRLEPHEESVLSNGDVVALGGLKLQVLLRPG
jgi:hypothetical protein